VTYIAGLILDEARKESEKKVMENNPQSKINTRRIDHA
jgi:hypothetical protein